MPFSFLLSRPAKIISSCWILLLPIAFVTKAMADEPIPPVQIAQRIDVILEDAMRKVDIQPGPLADDEVFLRRIYLDLVGRIPTAVETDQFLSANESRIREQLIDQLVNTSSYARHAAVFWRRTWVPQADTREFESLAEEVDVWIEGALAKNVPYDQLVKQLLTATSDAIAAGPNDPRTNAAPVAFLRASNFEAETLAANSARAFLGLDLDCAECHDHPFSRWTRDEFWQFAAFFETVKREDESSVPSIQISDSDRRVQARLFTGESVTWPRQLRPDEGRLVVADWMTQSNNEFLARNAVNRMWALYLGSGLVEPLDDISETNPASHPEVLEVLTDAFIDSRYDLRYISRCIVNTRAYQRSSETARGESPTQVPGATRLFARMPVRALTGEQLHDSLRVAIGLPLDRVDLPDRQRLAERQQIAKRFLSDRPAEAERSIPQALMMMNGEQTYFATTQSHSPLIRAVSFAPHLTHEDRVDLLFLSTVNRHPTPREVEILFGSAAEPTHDAYEDALWALLNSVEFNTNH